MKVISFLFVFVFAGLSIQAQSYQFEVLLMNKKIGDMKVSKIATSNGDRYILSSASSAKVLFIKQDSKVNFDVLFRGGALEKSLYISEKNDDNITTKINKENNLYKVYYNNQLSHVRERIGFSSIMLYFNEPIGVTRVFVERIGDFLPLTKSAPGQYEYLQPDGTRSIFRYQQGLLKEIELKRSMGSVLIRKTA